MAAIAKPLRRALVLIGFMGAGKSTVARELARALGVAPLDSDELLERRLGHSPARISSLTSRPSSSVRSPSPSPPANSIRAASASPAGSASGAASASSATHRYIAPLSR